MLWSLTLLAASALASASPLVQRWDDLAEKHAWSQTPRGWVLHSPAPDDHTITLHIALKSHHPDHLVSALYAVSNPTNSRYGAHLSQQDVAALVAPHPDALPTIHAWLAHHGLPLPAPSATAPGTLTLAIPISDASRLLNASYAVYHHPKSDIYRVRTMSYALPRVLHDHVAHVAPTTYFGSMRAMKTTSFLQPHTPIIEADSDDIITTVTGLAVPSSCSSTITPACLRALYNTTAYTPKATDKDTLGVAGYLEEFANRADLQIFFKKFRTDAVGATFNTMLVNGGGDNQSQPGTEANLDIQYTEGISFPTPNIYYSTGGSPPFVPDSNTPTNTNEPYLDWLNFILAQNTVPQTFTTSYGDDEQSVPPDYATTVCSLFAQLGARGSSIMFSSGDDGVGAGDCKTNDGTNTVRFQPNFPASCPFVTTVGGTTKVNPEVAVSFSGGGFSNLFAQPSYQAAAVAQYLGVIGTTNAGLFNTSGRAYPDVAAQGEGFQVVIGGRTESVAGTSASSPTFAAVISLLNDFRLSQGKPALGFLNPLLYAPGTGAALNAITSGSNPGCNTNGFTARKDARWSPVVGLGTPDFGKLQAVLENV